MSLNEKILSLLPSRMPDIIFELAKLGYPEEDIRRSILLLKKNNELTSLHNRSGGAFL